MIPPATRHAVYRRAQGCCEDCGRHARLELHHLRYTENTYEGPESIVGREMPDDLAALCRECHRSRHVDPAGTWWNDPEEMAVYWFTHDEEWARD